MPVRMCFRLKVSWLESNFPLFPNIYGIFIYFFSLSPVSIYFNLFLISLMPPSNSQLSYVLVKML